MRPYNRVGRDNESGDSGDVYHLLNEFTETLFISFCANKPNKRHLEINERHLRDTRIKAGCSTTLGVKTLAT